MMNRITERLKIVLFLVAFGSIVWSNVSCNKDDSATASAACGTGPYHWVDKAPPATPYCVNAEGKTVDSSCCPQ